jgi:polysaccharide biosynthesis transport protein
MPCYPRRQTIRADNEAEGAGTRYRCQPPRRACRLGPTYPGVTTLSNEPNNSQAASSPTVSAAQFIQQSRVLWTRKWLIVLIAAIGCAAAYGWTRTQARVYQADCTLEYDPDPPKPLGRAVEDAAGASHWWETREYFATQNKIIGSRAVAERVVRKLSLHENPDFWAVPQAERAEWRRASITDTAQRLQLMVTVSQERETRLVHLMIHDTSRERAMLLANSLADAYIEKTLEDRLGATTGALEWLGKQLDGLKLQLEQSELALHDFSEHHTNLAVSLEDQQNIVASNIQQLSRSLTDAKTRRIAMQARLDELRATNVDDPLQIQSGIILTNTMVLSLRERYSALQIERDALTVHYGDNHPKLIALDSQVETLKKALRSEVNGLIGAALSDVNEASNVEKGLKTALDQANRLGLELNLQEITHRRLQRERDNTAKLYGTLLERTAQTDLTRALQVAYVRVIDRALVPTVAVSPRVKTALLIGGVLGLLLGIVVALTLEQLDRVIRSVEDAEGTGITVLGVIPHINENVSADNNYGRRKRRERTAPVDNRDLIVHTHPKSSVAECCRTIRTNITFMSADRPRKTLVVTSASPREGKTTVSISLAISLAQSGKRILIVDTDLRKPRIHRAFNKPLTRGVTSILLGEHSAKEAIYDTEIPGLAVLACGPIPPNPSELLHTEQFRALLAELGKSYDHLILDSPPMAVVTDAAILAPQVDGTILIVHAQRTTRDALRSALRQLRDVSGHLIGGILNNVDLSSNRYGYSTSYYYRDESYTADSDPPPDDTDDDQGKRASAQV